MLRSHMPRSFGRPPGARQQLVVVVDAATFAAALSLSLSAMRDVCRTHACCVTIRPASPFPHPPQHGRHASHAHLPSPSQAREFSTQLLKFSAVAV